MTNEIRLAFAHPAERALELAEDRPHDRISLRDHIREVEIGAFEQERGHLQRLRFNIVVEVRPYAHPLNDDVDRILSYDRVTEAIDAEIGVERINLLETLSERIADRILTEPRAEKIFIRIEKLDRGPGALGVEIMREASKEHSALQTSATEMHAPRIIHLTNQALSRQDITKQLDPFMRAQEPVIISVSLPDEANAASLPPLVRRRIELLAIEQNAWRLAAKDQRCVVVNSRTELDWGIMHDQTSVWAPSKMVLDATHPPSLDAHRSAEMAIWFANEMQSRELIIVGNAEFLPNPSGDLNVTMLPITD